SLPGVGAIAHTIAPGGSTSLAIIGLDGNVWADLGAENPALGTATPMWFTPYGMPIDTGDAGSTTDVAGHESGWKELPRTDTVNPVVITPFRAMLPEIGSFTTPDPIEAGSTLYNYTDGDPFNQEDRTGLSPFEASRMFRSIGGITSIVLAVAAFFFPKKFVALALLDVAINAAMWTLMFATGDLDDGALIWAIAFSIISLVPLIPAGIRAYRSTTRTIHVRPPSNSISSSTSPSYSPAMRNPSPSPPPPNVTSSTAPTVAPTTRNVSSTSTSPVRTHPPVSYRNGTQLPTIRENSLQSSSHMVQTKMGPMTRDQARAFNAEQHRLVIKGLHTGGLI
ncbi:MAG: hypothetical protein AAFY28_21005, partial [Actinomycetota bacterium]